MPIPTPTIPGTIPATWDALMQALQVQGYDVATITEQGITTLNQLKDWAAAQGLELIEISEVVGYTFAKVAPSDPASTTAVTTQVVTDIATVGGAGTAVQTVTSGGPKALAFVSKLVAVSAAISLLVSEIGAALVPEEVEQDLITTADPYTIYNGEIPILIDADGTVHFMSEFIEAIRQRCIELGVFNTTSEIDTAQDSSKLNEPVSAYNFPIVPAAIDSGWSFNFRDGNDWHRFEFDSSDCPYNVYFMPFQREIPEGNIYVTIAYWSDVKGSDIGNPSDIGYVTIKDTNLTTAQTYTNRQWLRRIQAKDGTYYYMRVDRTYDQSRYTNIDPSPITINGVYGNTSPIESDLAYMLGNWMVPGEGVPGISPASDLISRGVTDMTKKISEVIPELDQNKIQTANPTDEDLENKRDWYPASINTEDVFTDGATEDETSTAPEGIVKPELEPDILDAVRDLIDSITPNPTIPVDDSGDTPPENPPLTPGSDGTGSNGLWSIYNPSLQAVHDFGAWLWSDTLADQFKRIFNSPIDGVIGFHLIYCTPIRGAAKSIKCGFLTSPVSADTVANQYVEIDCGTVPVNEYYGNALDYDNTSVSIYLPFVGIVPLDTHVVMGSSLNVTYRVDVLTGTCLAQIKVIKENSNAVMYAFEGNCSVQIPLTGTTYTGMVGALIGGLSASVSFMAGDMMHAVSGAASAVSSAMGGKAGFKQSGTMGSNAGALGIRIPYVIITHPITAMPAGFENVRGLPSTELVTLGSVSGFTSIRDIHLEGIPATAEEINEIKELLSEGVIF